MRKSELLQTITPLISNDYSLPISLAFIQGDQGLKEFNRFIRQSIEANKRQGTRNKRETHKING